MQGGGSGQSAGGMAMLMRAMEREECEAGTSLVEQARKTSPDPLRFPRLLFSGSRRTYTTPL